VNQTKSHHHYRQALDALNDPDATTIEKVEMLTEIAMELQTRPRHPEQLLEAIDLYSRALEYCPPSEPLLAARVRARKATALYMVPSENSELLVQAREELDAALLELSSHGSREEIAEAQMNLGLIYQALAQEHKAKITDAIAFYQQALQTFTRENYPAEYAIIHNNLATAFLSIPMSDERGKLREALAVQSFEAALDVITLEDSPSEYAMLQNNLGNALQYASSSHALENNLRALEAYDEALKVRTEQTTPLPYATTISNKANCLRNLPDDPEHPEKGNQQRLVQARQLYLDATRIFTAYGDKARTELLNNTVMEIERELSDLRSHRGQDAFGSSPI
jgi:tetratricopeptide (TPR) repeat protein